MGVEGGGVGGEGKEVGRGREGRGRVSGGWL